MAKPDDAALFERWRTGRDGDAFAELARRHAPVVYDLAARTLGDRTAAEDIVQEALLDLALEQSRRPAEVGIVAWLARFAICRAKNKRSSERARTRRQVVVGSRKPEESMPDDELERREELERALEHAEPEERAVLAMRYLHGWEYDRIARSLETSEGAARVRVHRALANVRNRLGVIERDVTAEGVTNRLAALPLLPLSAGSLDAAIRSALEAAGVPTTAAPVPRNRIPAALRAGSQIFGAAILVAAAATTVARLATDDVSAPSADVASADARAADLLLADATHGASGNSFASSRDVAVPRPENWDGGALARLARGDIEPDYAAPRSTDTPSAAEKEAAAPPQAAPALAGALPEAAPSPPIAFRPNSRGACAANCDSGSSDGERADAFGGLIRAAVSDPAQVVVEKAPVAETREPESDLRAGDDPLPHRAGPRGRDIASLSSDELVLVEQATALVRDVVQDAGLSADAAASPEHARRDGVRELRRRYHDGRRHAGADAARGSSAPMTQHKAARVNRVLSVLMDLALADGRIAGDLRWPDGVDVVAAIEDVMRMLSAAPGARRPDIANPTDAADAAPADDDRAPELQ